MEKFNSSITSLREDYRAKTLAIEDVLEDPIEQFKVWFKEALTTEEKEVNAMVLATTVEKRPSARVVLLKGVDNNGFYFYTNYESKKGIEIEKNPKVAIVFFWKQLERQVRIEGTANKVSKEMSLKYFQSRPKNSQIGAWSSSQSNIISNRDILTEKYKEISDKYKRETALPLPSNWGGYCIRADYFEFWQGRTSRLHDRIYYKLSLQEKWEIGRLAP